MSENPLLPTAYDIIWTLIVAAVAALAIWALVTVSKSTLDAPTKLAWAVFIILVPVLGIPVWAKYRRNRAADLANQR